MSFQPPHAHSSSPQPSSNGDSSAVTPDVAALDLHPERSDSAQELRWKWNETLKWVRASLPDFLLPFQNSYVDDLNLYPEKFKEETQADEPANSDTEPLTELAVAEVAIAQFRASPAYKKKHAKFLDPVDRPANDPSRNGHPPSAASTADVDEYLPESDEQLPPTDGDSDFEPDQLGCAPPLSEDWQFAEASASEQGCGAASEASCDSGLEDDLPQEPILENSTANEPAETGAVPEETPTNPAASVYREKSYAEKSAEVRKELANKGEGKEYKNVCLALTLQEEMNHLAWEPLGFNLSLTPGPLLQRLKEMQDIYLDLQREIVNGLGAALVQNIMSMMWFEALCEYEMGRTFHRKKKKIAGTLPQVSYRESLDQYLRVYGAKLSAMGLLKRIQELRQDDSLTRLPR